MSALGVWMKLFAEQINENLVIHVAQDRIDAACAVQFKDTMRELTRANHPRVILDMAQVAFIDSSGLGAIVAVMKSLGPELKLELSGLTTTVQKVFRLTRMDTIFTIHGQVPFGVAQAS